MMDFIKWKPLSYLTVTNNVKIGAGAVVLSDVPDGATVVGFKSNNQNLKILMGDVKHMHQIWNTLFR